VVKIVRDKDNRAEIKPNGDVVASSADELRSELKRLIGEGVSELTLNMTGVGVVDSIGLGLLISTHNSLAKAGGKLSVVNVSQDIHELFKNMRLDRHFTVTGA
jgi:anti-anti-sigma factor